MLRTNPVPAEEDESDEAECVFYQDIRVKRDFNEPKLLINAAWCQYDVIRDVAADLEMKAFYDEEEQNDWDILFQDGPIIPSLLMRM